MKAMEAVPRCVYELETTPRIREESADEATERSGIPGNYHRGALSPRLLITGPATCATPTGLSEPRPSRGRASNGEPVPLISPDLNFGDLDSLTQERASRRALPPRSTRRRARNPASLNGRSVSVRARRDRGSALPFRRSSNKGLSTRVSGKKYSIPVSGWSSSRLRQLLTLRNKGTIHTDGNESSRK